MPGRAVAKAGPKRKATRRPASVSRSVKEVESGGIVRRKGKVERSRSVEDDRQELLDKWAADPWDWLSGIDTTSDSHPYFPGVEFPHGVPLIWTRDESQRGDKAVRPWPSARERPYLRTLVHDVYYAEESVVLIDKCRQVMATWATTLLVDWECRFIPVRGWLLSKTKEEEAVTILDMKPRFVDERLPEWVRDLMPIRTRPRNRNFYTQTESWFRAVTENVADSEARGTAASGVLVDEAAFQRRLGEIVAAVQPMATRLWIISTPNVGNPGAKFMHDLCVEGLDERLM